MKTGELFTLFQKEFYTEKSSSFETENSLQIQAQDVLIFVRALPYIRLKIIVLQTQIRLANTNKMTNEMSLTYRVECTHTALCFILAYRMSREEIKVLKT